VGRTSVAMAAGTANETAVAVMAELACLGHVPSVILGCFGQLWIDGLGRQSVVGADLIGVPPHLDQRGVLVQKRLFLGLFGANCRSKKCKYES